MSTSDLDLPVEIAIEEDVIWYIYNRYLFSEGLVLGFIAIEHLRPLPPCTDINGEDVIWHVTIICFDCLFLFCYIWHFVEGI